MRWDHYKIMELMAPDGSIINAELYEIAENDNVNEDEEYIYLVCPCPRPISICWRAPAHGVGYYHGVCPNCGESIGFHHLYAGELEGEK